MLDVNIILVNYHNRDDLVRAIGSVLADLNGDQILFQISIVDNSQNADGIKEAAGALSRQIKYVDALGNIGFGAANNLGFKTFEARYQFILNPDAVIPSTSQTIARLIKFLDEHPLVAAVGPKLIYPDGALQPSCYRFDRPSILVKPLKQINWDAKYRWIKKFVDRLEMNDFDHTQARPVDWVLGAATIYRSDALKKVGYFDERYFMYFEDCDLCHKFWEAGLPVYYYPEVEIIHRHARASAAVPGALFALLRNKLARSHLASWFKYLWKWRKLHKYYAKLS